MNRIHSLVAAAMASAAAFCTSLLMGPPVTRSKTRDVAFLHRMPAGFAGDVNRTHPASILPGLPNATTPPRMAGDPCLVDTATNTYKGLVAGDASATAIAIQGVLVRSYPTQQQSGGMSTAFGQAAGPTSGTIDVLEEGYIMVKLPAGSTVTKNGAVFAWCAANSGLNVQGGFVGAASAGNTVPITNAKFNGPAAADGTAEIKVMAL